MAQNRRTYWQRLTKNFVSPKEPWFLDGQPEAIKDFMKTFEPQNEYELGLFRYLKTGVETFHIPLEHQDHIIAQLGDPPVLRYLFEQHPDNQNSVRSYIASNPRCPDDLVKQCLRDRNPDVRSAVVTGPHLSDDFCINYALHEPDAFVQQVLKERLGAQYPFFPVKSSHIISDEVNAFIDRCFEHNRTHPSDQVNMQPILSAYLEYTIASPSTEAERQLHEKLVDFADAPLLDAFDRRYITDYRMLAKIIENPNCPTDLKEQISFHLSLSDEFEQTISSQPNEVKSAGEYRYTHSSAPKNVEASRPDAKINTTAPKPSLDSMLKSAAVRSQASREVKNQHTIRKSDFNR